MHGEGYNSEKSQAYSLAGRYSRQSKLDAGAAIGNSLPIPGFGLQVNYTAKHFLALHHLI